MDQAELVNEDMHDGAELLRVTDADPGVRLTALLWVYDSREPSWELIAEKKDAAMTPAIFAAGLHRAVDNEPDLAKRQALKRLLLGPVRISTEPHPLAQILRVATARRPSAGAPLRLRNVRHQTYVVEDTLIYRL
jgi:hypothetical protein